MKNTLLLILIFITLLSLSSCGKIDDKASENETLTNAIAATTSEEENANVSALDPDISSYSDLSTNTSVQKNVETYTKELITANAGATIDSLTVMESRATPDTDDYKVYAIITWNKEYSATESQQILQGYSKNIATFVDAKLGNVHDLSLVWLVPNLNGTAYINYEKIDGMLSLNEENFDTKFGVTSEGTTDLTLQNITNAAVNTIVTESAVSI